MSSRTDTVLKKSKQIFICISVMLLLNSTTLTAQEEIVENCNINSKLQSNFTIIVPPHEYDLNPHTSGYRNEAQILIGLYEGLFSCNSLTLEPEYALAESFITSRDKKRWTFILKENITFSDGRAITSQTVKDSWLKMLSNPYAPYSSLFDIVKGASEYRTGKTSKENVEIFTPDEKTLKLNLKSPASHLPKILCLSAFAVTGNNENQFSGPFILAKHEEDKIILKKNNLYHDAKNVHLEQITFEMSDDSTENSFRYNAGQCQWIDGIADIEKLISKEAIQLNAEFATEFLFFKMNDDKNTLWNKAEFRQALLEAVPWEELRKNVFVKAESLVYPLNNYPKVQGYKYTDIDEAKLIIKEARKKYSIAEDKIITIKFAIHDSKRMQEMANLLKTAWEEIGVKLEQIIMPTEQYLSKIAKTDAHLFLYTWIGDFADALTFLELFKSSSAMNVSGWKNLEYDLSIEKSALYTDENHNKLLSNAEQILLDEAVIIPIQHPVCQNIINLNEVGGWSANAFNIHPLKNLYIKETKNNFQNFVLLK